MLYAYRHWFHLHHTAENSPFFLMIGFSKAEAPHLVLISWIDSRLLDFAFLPACTTIQPLSTVILEVVVGHNCACFDIVGLIDR
jgi:hypothetical protein